MVSGVIVCGLYVLFVSFFQSPKCKPPLQKSQPLLTNYFPPCYKQIMTFRDYIKASNLTHEQWAERLGLSRVTVTNYANGHKPTLENAVKIAKCTDNVVPVESWIST